MDASKQFIRYAIVGLTSNVVIYVIYITLTWFGISPKIAMTLLYIFGVLQTFIFNKGWSFQHKGEIAPALVRYLVLYISGYFINLTLLILLVDKAGFPHELVMAGLILFMAIFFFFGQKFWAFRQSELPTGTHFE